MAGELQASSTTKTGEPGQVLRLLIVDDDALSRSMMEIMLTPGGYKLDFACDGAEALQAIESQAYDLVFLDLILPDMNGRDVCREVRRWEAGKQHVPIVAVTAYDLPGQPLELVKAGMDDYVFKPFDARGLTRMVRLYAGGESDDAKGRSDDQAAAALLEAPVLDIAGSLEDFSNDATSYQELLKDFVESLPARLGKMQQAQADGDVDRFGRECHSLKGISAGLGAMRLSRLAGQLSHAIQSGNAAATPGTLRQIEQGIAELQEEAHTYLAG